MPVTPLCMANTMNPVEIDISTVTICTNREQMLTIPIKLIH